MTGELGLGVSSKILPLLTFSMPAEWEDESRQYLGIKAVSDPTGRSLRSESQNGKPPNSIRTLKTTSRRTSKSFHHPDPVAARKLLIDSMVFQLPKAIRFALVGYAIAASLHTSNKLLAAIFGSDTSLFGTSWWPYAGRSNRQSSAEPQIVLADLSSPNDEGLLSISESTFLSKAFSNSMQPNNIRPYYFRATHDLNRNDVTITTQITLNRFEAFSNLVNKYQGELLVHSSAQEPPYLFFLKVLYQ